MIFIIISVVVHASAAQTNVSEEWRISPRKANIPNPISLENASVQVGKGIFQRESQECHGDAGKGDGTEFAELDKAVYVELLILPISAAIIQNFAIPILLP